MIRHDDPRSQIVTCAVEQPYCGLDQHSDFRFAEMTFATSLVEISLQFGPALTVVDKDSHSVVKVTTDGAIHTVAGTHTPGNGPDGPMPATNVQLNAPNGLWVRGDGTVYVLDTGNGKVRRLGTDGMMATLLTDGNGIAGGRGLWVRDDEGFIYYADNPEVPGGGISTLNNRSFVDLGNLIADSANNVLVTDRGANRFWSRFIPSFSERSWRRAFGRRSLAYARKHVCNTRADGRRH